MDLNNNKSQKGSLRVYSLALLAVDFSTIVLRVLAPRHHLMMDLNSDESQKGNLGVDTPAVFAADFSTIVSGI